MTTEQPTSAATTKTDPISEMAARFKRDTADHKMTVLHDDGVYRHVRFSAAGSSFYWFDLVTWPGSLVIKGDCGTYVFSRLTDMFEFFRGSRQINPSYWGEKTPDGTRSVREYSEDRLKALLSEALAEYEADFPERIAEYETARATYDATPLVQRRGRTTEPMAPAEARERFADFDADGLLSHESGAHELLRGLEEAGVIPQWWEWDLTDWEWSFLWCCHAIVSGIAQYDARVPAAVSPVADKEADDAR